MLKRSACKPRELRAHNRHGDRENLREEQRAESNSVLPPTLEAEDDKGSGKEAILLWREDRTGLGNLEDSCWPSLRQLTLLPNGPLSLEGSLQFSETEKNVTPWAQYPQL